MRNLVILASLAVLIGVVIYFDRGRPTTDDSRRATEQLFPNLVPANISKISIERRGHTQSLERKRDGWWVDGRRADDAAAEAILSTLAWGRVERPVDARARAASGVDDPRVYLTAEGIDLRLGNDGAGGGVYVLRGQQLLVAEHRLLEVTDLDSFVSRAAVLEDPGAASTLQLGPLSLERHGASFRMLSPKPALADAARIAPLLESLTRARAVRVEAEPAPSPAPGEEIISFDGRTQARVRWEGCDKLPQVIRADGAVLCFAAEALAPLHADPDSLRELHLTAFQLDDVDAADFELVGKKLSLRHADHAWKIAADGPADDAAVRDRLGEILKLRARALAIPTGRALGRVRLSGGGETVEATLSQNGKELLIQRAGEDRALILPASALALFDADPLPLASRRVDTFRPDAVTAFSRDGHTLPLADEKNARLIDALSNLHAESLQRREFTATHTLTVVAGGATHRFELGPRDADGCLVRAGTSNTTYVVSPATCNLLY